MTSILNERVDIAFSRRNARGLETLLSSTTELRERSLDMKILKGLALGKRGAAEIAVPACADLLGRYTEQSQPLAAARAQLTCAEVALAAGDRTRGETLARAAQKFFVRNQCIEAAWRASLLLALSRPDAKLDTARAEEDLQALKRDWATDDLAKYLSRPDIHRLYQKLNTPREQSP